MIGFRNFLNAIEPLNLKPTHPLDMVGNGLNRVKTLVEEGVSSIPKVAQRDSEITKAYIKSVQQDGFFFGGVAPLARLDKQQALPLPESPSFLDKVNDLLPFADLQTQFKEELYTVPSNYVILQIKKLGQIKTEVLDDPASFKIPNPLQKDTQKVGVEIEDSLNSIGQITAQSVQKALAKLNLSLAETAEVLNIYNELETLGKNGEAFVPYANFLKRRLSEELAKGLESPGLFKVEALPFRVADIAFVKAVQSNADQIGSIPNLPSYIKPWLKSSREAPYFSVSLEQAKVKVEKAFPNTYEIKEAFRSASIGNVFMGIHKETGQEVAIKIRHPHVNPPNITEGREALRPVIEILTKDEPNKEVIQESFEQYYKGFLEEADFRNEFKRTQDMAQKSSFKIPEVFDATEDIIVTERISGISLGELFTYFKAWNDIKKEAPSLDEAKKLYQNKFQKEIEKYPFLGNLDNLRQDTVDKMAALMNEQFEKPVNLGTGVNPFHDDLHPGNIFVVAKQNNPTELDYVLIDHGGAGYIGEKQLLLGVRQAFNTMVGNSKTLAEDLVDTGILTESAQKEDPKVLKTKIAQALEDQVFKARVNLSGTEVNQKIQAILEEQGVMLNPELSKYFVSFLKGRNTLKELQELTGTTVSTAQSNKNKQESLQAMFDTDIGSAVKGMLPTVWYTLTHPNEARRTAYQFLQS
jgi:predicted unusual protein kinase regulating ubiquinone biosynthesis (AarF/ABC1/UbiB family)